MKIKFLLIALLTSLLSAQEIRVFVSGSQLIPTDKGSKAENEAYAKEHALINAKQEAIEQAGTTVYSSFEMNGINGIINTKSRAESISAGLIKTKLLSERIRQHKYFVNIEATVDVLDAEELFKKSDKRLKEIDRLSKKNKKIVQELKSVSQKLTNAIGNVKYLSKKEKLYVKQESLVKQYKVNSKKMRLVFKKGMLADMAKSNKTRRDNELENAQREFDKHFTKPFFTNFYAQMVNIMPVKKGNVADIEFILIFVNNDNLKDINVGIHTGYKGYSKKKTRKYRYRFDWIYFKDDKTSQDFHRWAKAKRNMAIVVKLGNREYITERVVKSFENGATDDPRKYEVGSIINKIDAYAGHKYTIGIEYLDSPNGVLTHRIIKNVPMKILENTTSITTELRLFPSSDFLRNGNFSETKQTRKKGMYALPNKGEAVRYY